MTLHELETQRYARPRSGNLPAFFRGVGQACYSVQYQPQSPPLLGGAGAMGMYGIHYLTYEEIYIQL